VKIPQMHAVCSEQAHPLLPSLNSHSPPSHVFYWNSLYSPQASNAPCFFLHLLSAEIIGVHYHARHPWHFLRRFLQKNQYLPWSWVCWHSL
jgi:hypothetical protein